MTAARSSWDGDDNATLLPGTREYPAGAGRDGFWYKCVAEPADVHLLPVSERVWEVPVGRDGMGQANVLYPIGGDGRSRIQSAGYEWMRRVLAQIDAYTGAADEETIAESLGAAARGQGFDSDPAWRGAIEQHAMDAAIRHLQDEGYDPMDEHKGHPYDLRCTKGQDVLFVEVKGTTTAGESVLVTSGEVRFARRNVPNTVLFILHSVERGKSGEPVGGKAVVLRPWNPSDDSLSPIAYTYNRAM